MTNAAELRQEIQHLHDEAALKLHLASMDLKQEWNALEARWQDFQDKAKLGESAKGVSEAIVDLGRELKKAFSRFCKALENEKSTRH